MSVDLDRLKAAFDQAVEAALPNVDYHALYTCQVVSQNGDGTLDLKPQRTDWPTQKNIPIRCGVPNLKIKVQANAQVLLGWENGDPSIPFAGLWLVGASGDLISFELTAAMLMNLTAPMVNLGANAESNAVPLDAVVRAGNVQMSTAGPYPIVGAAVVGSTSVTASS